MPFDSYPSLNRELPPAPPPISPSQDFGKTATSKNLAEKSNYVKFQSLLTFQGDIAVNNSVFLTQNFSIQEKNGCVFIQNYPTNSLPKVEIVLEVRNTENPVKEFKIRPSEDTVQGEILYTRLFLLIEETKNFSINFKDRNFSSIDFNFSELPLEEKKKMRFRAKLFRKLGFIEKVFPNAKFVVPKDISPTDARQIEILYRGLTEGEFSSPLGNSITVFNYKLTKEDLENLSIPKRKSFSFEFDEDLLVLGNLFPIGKMIFKADKASIANPRVLKNFTEGETVPNLRLSIFDYQVNHRFEKYLNKERFLRNKRKLEQFKNSLRQAEPAFLVNLIDEPLAEITEKSAIEIVEGLLQYHDFPDRFSVLEPKLEKNRWRVPIGLTYPKHQPIWLEDAFVDVQTGKYQMKLSFDKLLKKGKEKAKEAFPLG